MANYTVTVSATKPAGGGGGGGGGFAFYVDLVATRIIDNGTSKVVDERTIGSNAANEAAAIAEVLANAAASQPDPVPGPVQYTVSYVSTTAPVDVGSGGGDAVLETLTTGIIAANPAAALAAAIAQFQATADPSVTFIGVRVQATC